ncbi:hypothetical protein P8Q88_13450 [Qipengyuania sp. XHP0207]|uniref:hypothetical protein n=1 Tax=Qipengyuania sp. XHP0207 TaxID=3038078 RepID=UPI00241D1ADD|nr:hypothetical protein [Qipengyuania sp. XHP0207]MDG5749181.1 hypothetical protein [Qipengyuania sp. XHP0207]
MIGKVIGAFVGDRIAKQTKGVGGATGAALGVVATTLLRRMSLPAMIALGAGGYVAKKMMDKNTGDTADTASPATTTTAPKANKIAA